MNKEKVFVMSTTKLWNPWFKSFRKTKFLLEKFWPITEHAAERNSRQTSNSHQIVKRLLLLIMYFVSVEAVEIRWRYKDDFVERNSRANLVAAYTTAQVCLKLFLLLAKKNSFRRLFRLLDERGYQQSYKVFVSLCVLKLRLWTDETRWGWEYSSTL